MGNNYQFKNREADDLYGTLIGYYISDSYNHDDVINLGKKILDLEPNIEDAYFFYIIGDTYMDKKDYDNASVYLRGAEKYIQTLGSSHLELYCKSRLMRHRAYICGLRGMEDGSPHSLEESIEHINKSISFYEDIGLDIDPDFIDECKALRTVVLREMESFHELQRRATELLRINEEASGKVNKSCFVATTIYGDLYSEEVVALRDFRDNILSKYLLGKLFIIYYYRYAPYIVKMIEGKIYIIKILKYSFHNTFFKLVLLLNKYR